MTAALRHCTYGGCWRLVEHGRCPEHQHPGWASTAGTPRVRGRRLQRWRRELFEAQPLCVLCRAEGRVVPATIRDHIIPLAEGGTDDLANIQALCQTCSDRKTALEAHRGRTK